MPSVEFNRLRKILAEPTSQRLDRVEDQLVSIEERLEVSHKAKEISEVLPEAVRIGARKGPDLANNLGPIVESALDKSIERNTDKVASALYPVLGAMVRKYVASALRDATESINLLVGRALTLEGIRWRWESARTGVPISKIAFKHSLVYRCEHVFLIHNKTAQPLFHLTAADAIEADKLAFAGMLGAITDFIKDAFLREEPIGLRSISVGDFTIWFEEGPIATLAVVIRGEPQPAIRYRLRTVCAQLHEQYPAELENAMVDEVSLLNYDTMLRGTLVQQRREEQKRKRRVGRIAIASIASILAIIGLADLNGIRVAHAQDDRFERFVTDLKNREGVLITDYGKRGGKYFLSGVVTGSLSSAALPV